MTRLLANTIATATLFQIGTCRRRRGRCADGTSEPRIITLSSAGSTVTNTGPSVINGDIGLWSGTAITGFPPGVLPATGTMHITDGASAAGSVGYLTTGYTTLMGMPFADLTCRA